MKEKTALAFLLFFCSGCLNSVSQRRIRSIHKIRDFFEISRISVSTFNEEGIPLKYEEDTSVMCSAGRDTATLEEKLTPSQFIIYNSLQDTIRSIYNRHCIKLADSTRMMDLDKLDSAEFHTYCNAEIIADSIVGLYPDEFHARRKIYFSKPNKNYYWDLYLDESASFSFPMIFRKNTWYEIGDFDYAFGSYTIFIYIDEKGRMHKHYDRKKAAWPI